nr:hypothetical protein [Roseococcus sp. MDT2-1-1]
MPGHFPGHPIVPGVLLLDEVMQAIARRDGAAPTALLRAKFIAPVAPEETVEVEFGPAGPRLSFTCHVGARVVARGEFGCPAPPSR